MFDLADIPQGWFLDSMKDQRTPILRDGDTYDHFCWEVNLQHVGGGRLARGAGFTPEAAFAIAMSFVRKS